MGTGIYQTVISLNNDVCLYLRLALRCTMLNMSGREVRQGLASGDEMCDVYLVYTGPRLLEGNTYCTNPGPPASNWTTQGFNNIPQIRASTLP